MSPPLVEAGFSDQDGRGEPSKLIQWGPTVQVAVGAILPEPEGDSSAPRETAFALVDTGATESCIDEDLAKLLQLPVVDVVNIAGSQGAHAHSVYLARVDIVHLGIHQYGKFAGVKLADGGQQHTVLLGRTFLQTCIMIYDGIRGHCTLAAANP